MTRRRASCLAVAFLAIAVPALSVLAAELPYAPDRLLVQFRAGSLEGTALQLPLEKGAATRGAATGLADLDALTRAAGVTGVERPFPLPANAAKAAGSGVDRWFLFRFAAAADLPGLADALAALPEVEAVSLDWRVYPAAVPTDPYYASNWGHDNTAQLPGIEWGVTNSHTGAGVGIAGVDANTSAAWDQPQGYGSSDVVIAIIDTGVDVDHPDLRLVAGYDFGDNDANPDDNATGGGHGTCCAGIAAALANGTGTVGVAPGCSVMPLKVANSAGQMYTSAIASALYWAADHGADIASLSLGAAIASDAACDAAILYAYNAGVTILAASGNNNASTLSYPAVNPYVIGVGAASPCGDRKRSSSSAAQVNPGVSVDPLGVTCDGERWWGSNYGVATADAAGAVDILGPTILPATDIAGAGRYSAGDVSPFFNGTSCATPYVAGVAALLKSASTGATPAQVRAALVTTARDVTNAESGAGWDRYAGYGLVDALAALASLVPAEPVADFTASAVTGYAPLAVTFTDRSAGVPTGWSWSFGDGGTATTRNPSHTFAAAGTYTVALTVTNDLGTDTLTRAGYVTVSALTGTWTTITFDNFETGMGSFADGGTDMFRYTGTTYARQGKCAADIQDNSLVQSSFYHARGYNVTGYAALKVEFFYRAVGMETGEDFFIEYFNGTVWQRAATYVCGTHFTNGAYVAATINLSRSTYTFPATAKLRFRCDASDDTDDIYIDQIRFSGLVAAALGARSDEAAPLDVTAARATLDQNRPNPFNPVTTIAFRLPRALPVRLTVYDLRGREVARLVDGELPAGAHEVAWDATGCASGLYVCRLEGPGVLETRKLTLVK